VGGVLEADDGGYALVGGAVDHHPLVFVFLLYAAVEVFPDDYHNEPDGHQQGEGDHGVDAGEQDVGPEEAGEGDYDGQDEDAFQARGGCEDEVVLGGEPADDDPVGAEDGEGNGRGCRRQDQVAEFRAYSGDGGYVEVPQDGIYDEQDQDGCQDRQDDVHREDDGSAEVVVLESLDQGL